MFILPLLAGLASGQAVAKHVVRSSASYPTVNTTSGYVRGAGSEYRDGVTVYKGIPFASPPTGSLRWKAPVAPEPWNDVLNATAFGPACAQPASTAGIFSSGIAASEDCLYLNVWTPTYNETDVTSKNLPVFFWIYGGRFEGGSGDVKTYEGSGLASKDIIVVTINYRLGPFGFLAHPELNDESGHNASGNYGLMDQQFALKWVQENIANFGGNPNQVTVGGQSAGSASALDMMWSPLSRDLINGVISESGARGPHDPVTGSAATSWRTKAAAEAEGVDFVKNSLNVSSITEARNVTTDALLDYVNESDTIFENTQFANDSSGFMEPPLWRPVIDGYVLRHTYGEALRLNDHADVPILTGNNKDESGASPDTDYNATAYKTLYSGMFGGNFSSRFFELYPGSNETEASENSNEFFRDLSRVGTWRWSVDWAAGGAKSNVYTYYFTTAPAENRDEGAYHGSELWYTFNNIPYADYSNVTWSPHDYEVERIMSQYWANFIRTGDPNGGNLTRFPPSTSEERQTMWLGDSWGSGYLSKSEERVKFIESWYSTLQEW